jgi:hypothetical protein
MKITKKERISILKRAKKLLIQNERGTGICDYLAQVSSILPHASRVVECGMIKGFDFKNVKLFCKENKLPMPRRFYTECGYWWKKEDIATRVKVIDWLITIQ